MVWRVTCSEIDFYLEASSAEEAIKIFKRHKNTDKNRAGHLFYTITSVSKVYNASILYETYRQKAS